MTQKTIKKYIFIFVFLLPSTYSHAEWPKKPSDFRLLPQYCKALLIPEFKKTQYKHWARIIGPGFGHSHHFCAAMFSYLQADRIFPKNKEEKQRKKFLYRETINEIEYIEKNVKSKRYKLWPEVYSLKAEAYERMGDTKKAIRYFMKAIQSNPRYPRSYAAFASFLQKNHQKKQAIKILKIGLKYNPKSKMLKSKLSRISHKK